MHNNFTKNYTSSWQIIKRHWKTTLPYLNFIKILNIIHAKIEEKLGRIKIKSKPYFVKIDPTNKCNLRCKGCLHALERKDLENNNRLGSMDFELFKKIIDELEKYLVKVSLYFLGEPLIYPKIVEMVQYLTERNIGSVISSNLNFLPEWLAHNLVKKRLTHLIVSLDGANEEGYLRYRVGGSFEKVIKNLKLIQKEKKIQSSHYPLIEVQTIQFDYILNNEINEIKKLCRELEVTKFSLKENITPLYENPNPTKKTCFWLYGNPSFHWNGMVQPCCHFYEYENSNFGNIAKQTFRSIYNNEDYQAARKYFKTGKKLGKNLKCYNCIFFTR
jgi:radical SAM protein with 4Fe4S-binding SPASM domain